MIFRKILINSINSKNIIYRSLHSRYKVLFFGTDNFSLPTLKLISNQKNHELISHLEVVTSYKAMKNPVREYSHSNKLITHNWEDLKSNFEICSKFDFGLVVSFGHLIPENIINSFKNGMLNVHASLLPQYRGASPIIYAIKDHQKITGVTIMKIEPNKFDVGDILAMEKVAISDDTLMPQLHDNLANIGAQLLVDCIRKYNDLKPMKQDNRSASYAPKISNEFCKVRWDEMTSTQVFDLYRALYSFKHVTTIFNNTSVKLLEIAKPNNANVVTNDNRKSGHVKFCWKTKRLLVKCKDEIAVEIIKLSIGKKVMSATDFNNGFLRKRSESQNMFE